MSKIGARRDRKPKMIEEMKKVIKFFLKEKNPTEIGLQLNLIFKEELIQYL